MFVILLWWRIEIIFLVYNFLTFDLKSHFHSSTTSTAKQIWILMDLIFFGNYVHEFIFSEAN